MGDTNEITTASTMRIMTSMRRSSHNCLLSYQYHLRVLPGGEAEEETDAGAAGSRLSQRCATSPLAGAAAKLLPLSFSYPCVQSIFPVVVSLFFCSSSLVGGGSRSLFFVGERKKKSSRTTQ